MYLFTFHHCLCLPCDDMPEWLLWNLLFAFCTNCRPFQMVSISILRYLVKKKGDIWFSWYRPALMLPSYVFNFCRLVLLVSPAVVSGSGYFRHGEGGCVQYIWVFSVVCTGCKMPSIEMVLAGLDMNALCCDVVPLV